MEKEGFIRCIRQIQDDWDLIIRVISTDRHPSIKKLMRTDPEFSTIIHQFDPWHIGKGLIKKLIKASKKKGKNGCKYNAGLGTTKNSHFETYKIS